MKMELKGLMEPLLIGSTFFGTGGGGSPTRAREILMKLEQQNDIPDMVTVDDVSDTCLCITGFPIGGLTAQVIPKSIFSSMIQRYVTMVSNPIQAIIPVEIGPLSIAVALSLANMLDIPVVDADIVGGRSSPEVFLETISMFGISRIPLLVFNKQGEFEVLSKNVSYKEEEIFLRTFAAKSNGFAYVIGYPLTKRMMKQSIASGTVSQAITIGSLLRNGKYTAVVRSLMGTILFRGIVSKNIPITQNGFSSRLIEIQRNKDTARIYIKNESLIVWVNTNVVLTCPDLIILMTPQGIPLTNEEIAVGQRVEVLGIPCNTLWNSKKGRLLFNPKQFGFSVPQRLLKRSL